MKENKGEAFTHTIRSTYTWSRFNYRVKAKSKNSVMLSHARVHI